MNAGRVPISITLRYFQYLAAALYSEVYSGLVLQPARQ